jgi:hypothetical protein
LVAQRSGGGLGEADQADVDAVDERPEGGGEEDGGRREKGNELRGVARPARAKMEPAIPMSGKSGPMVEICWWPCLTHRSRRMPATPPRRPR